MIPSQSPHGFTGAAALPVQLPPGAWRRHSAPSPSEQLAGYGRFTPTPGTSTPSNFGVPQSPFSPPMQNGMVAGFGNQSVPLNVLQARGSVSPSRAHAYAQQQQQDASPRHSQQQYGFGQSVPMQQFRQSQQSQPTLDKTQSQPLPGKTASPRRSTRDVSPRGRSSIRDVSPGGSARDTTPAPPAERRGASPRHSSKSMVPHGVGRFRHPSNGGAPPVQAPQQSAQAPHKQSISLPAPQEDPSALDIPTELNCQKGHLMRAKVVREVWNKISWWYYQTYCDVCGERITSKHARYYCKECKYSVCMKCTSNLLAVNRNDAARIKLPPTSFCHAAISATVPSPLRVLPGDILLLGPDKWGVHHAVLTTGPMKPDEQVGQEIKADWPEMRSMDIFSCPTIESTAQAKGEDIVWYPSIYFFARDRSTGDSMLVADMPQKSILMADMQQTGDEIELCNPMPVKLLLHPCRPGHGGPPSVDLTVFRHAVEESAQNSQAWSLRTAAKGVMGRRKVKSRLEAEDYPDPESRSEMLDELHKRWDNRPICTSVIIQVWQRYFELVAGDSPEGQDVAAQNILRWMPLFCDSTLPSALIKELSKCNWVMRGNLDA